MTTNSVTYFVKWNKVTTILLTIFGLLCEQSFYTVSAPFRNCKQCYCVQKHREYDKYNCYSTSRLSRQKVIFKRTTGCLYMNDKTMLSFHNNVITFTMCSMALKILYPFVHSCKNLCCVQWPENDRSNTTLKYCQTLWFEAVKQYCHYCRISWS